jgi:hypothetical protein
MSDELSSAQNAQNVQKIPFWLVVLLSLGGIAAFLLIGLFGYADDPPLARDLLRQPWPLFTWLCAMWLFIYSLNSPAELGAAAPTKPTTLRTPYGGPAATYSRDARRRTLSHHTL